MVNDLRVVYLKTWVRLQVEEQRIFFPRAGFARLGLTGNTSIIIAVSLSSSLVFYSCLNSISLLKLCDNLVDISNVFKELQSVSGQTTDDTPHTLGLNVPYTVASFVDHDIAKRTWWIISAWVVDRDDPDATKDLPNLPLALEYRASSIPENLRFKASAISSS